MNGNVNVPTTRFCPQCGEKLQSAALFCPQCGADLGPAVSAAAATPDAVPPATPAVTITPTQMPASVPVPKGQSPGVIAKVVIFAVIAVVAVAAIVFVPKILAKASPKPFDAIERFEKAYNELDYTGLIECVDPRVVNLASELGASISSALGGDGDSALAKDMLPLLGDYLSSYAGEYWGDKGVTMTMEITEISTDMVRDDKAKVKCTIKVTSSDGDEKESEETINTVMVDDKWYIALF